MVHVYQNDGKSFTTKNLCRPGSLLSVDSEIFEKLPNNRLVNRIKKCGVFSKFQNGFRSPQSTADLLLDVSNTLTELVLLLIGLGLLHLLHLIYPRLLLDFLTNASLMEF